MKGGLSRKVGKHIAVFTDIAEAWGLEKIHASWKVFCCVFFTDVNSPKLNVATIVIMDLQNYCMFNWTTHGLKAFCQNGGR